MEYDVERGNPLEITWDLPGVADLPDGSITLDVVASKVVLMLEDKSTVVLRMMNDIIIERSIVEESKHAYGPVRAIMRKDDTSEWALGSIQFAAEFLFKDGSSCAGYEGTIAVLPQSGERIAAPVRPWNLLNPLEYRAPQEEQDARLATCKGCPRLKKGVCVECGCVMKMKAKLARAHCPLGHWGMSDSPVPNEGLPEFLEIKLKHFGS